MATAPVYAPGALPVGFTATSAYVNTPLAAPPLIGATLIQAWFPVANHPSVPSPSLVMPSCCTRLPVLPTVMSHVRLSGVKPMAGDAATIFRETGIDCGLL